MSRQKSEEWLIQLGLALNNEAAITRIVLPAKDLWQPRVNLFESEGWIIVRAEVAGAVSETVQIHYMPDRHSIVFRGRREDTSGIYPTAWYQLEIPNGEFGREVELPPANIDVKGIKAQLKNGILDIMVPKSEQTRVKLVSE